MRRSVRVGGIIDHIINFFGCSHERAATLLSSSIHLPKNCDLGLFCPCEDIHTKRDRNCSISERQYLGIGALPSRPGQFCGNTPDSPPYMTCH